MSFTAEEDAEEKTNWLFSTFLKTICRRPDTWAGMMHIQIAVFGVYKRWIVFTITRANKPNLRISFFLILKYDCISKTYFAGCYTCKSVSGKRRIFELV